MMTFPTDMEKYERCSEPPTSQIITEPMEVQLLITVTEETWSFNKWRFNQENMVKNENLTGMFNCHKVLNSLN